ncbi:biotin-dependent carboxyltransferase family protein [Bacillus massiliigorillae]|uniref:5-oxoprolinase subunit C family protein n=1 Tax=Bacillus massiliigorillae TaxID=1243664 RepID=UPI0003A43140|nr:biotin-dependent carboxyltransferase family protein [Bacillus massiliigorillae]
MITVLKPGLLTTIQDLGRFGFQKYGVIASGAMDPLSHRIANMLVGNKEDEAVMEITLVGPTLQFEQDVVIALCGADFSPLLDGKLISMWKPVIVKRGNILTIGSAKRGCRAYLSVSGGFAISEIMNSKSTYLRGKIGGFKGRALRKNDQIQLTHLPLHINIRNNWRPTTKLVPNLNSNKIIRVIQGRQYHLFSEDSLNVFFSEDFEISISSDRMGYRLKGPHLTLKNKKEMISEAVSFGTIQVPAEGNPIILLADRQTTGGYPKIAQVVSVDLPHLAQAKPGDKLRFLQVSHEEAQKLYLRREIKMNILKKAINFKLH